MSKEKLTGAELVIRGLEYLNVSTVFGVPGSGPQKVTKSRSLLYGPDGIYGSSS